MYVRLSTYSSSISCVPPVRSTAEIINTWLEYNKAKIQARGRIFSNFGGEVCPEGGHGKYCRSRTLTGAPKELICAPSMIGLLGTLVARAEKRNIVERTNDARRGRQFWQNQLHFVRSATQGFLEPLLSCDHSHRYHTSVHFDMRSLQ